MSPRGEGGGPSHLFALVAALAAITTFLLVITVTPVANNDIWLHLENGRLILEQGRVPKADPYSFTAAGARFYAHEWLAGVIFELVHRAAGIGGLIALKPLFGGAAVLLSALAGRRLGAGRLASLVVAALAVALASARFVERPELFSYALTGIYLLVLAIEQGKLSVEAQEERSPGSMWPAAILGRSSLWLLVPAQWLWVQLHGYFLTGLALIGIFLGGEIAQRILQARRVSRRAISPRLASGCVALAVMAGLGAVNPNGLEIYRFPFDVVNTRLFMQSIFEWMPPFTTEPVRALPMFTGFCLWTSLLAAACLDSPALLRRSDLWRAVGGGGLVAIGVLHPLVAPASLPAGLALRGTLWAWSPLRLLFTYGGRPDLERALGPIGDGLGAVGLFGALWLVLFVCWIVSWRRPSVAGIAIGVASLFFMLRGAGEYALVAEIILAGFLAYAGLRGTMPLWQCAAALFFFALAVRQNRNIVNFTLVTLPILAAALTRLRRALPDASHQAGARSLGIASLAAATLGLAACAAAFGWPNGLNYQKPGLGVDRRFPAGAVRYVRENGIEGNSFNTYFNGAYLIHELYPETRVFVDSRMDVYGPDRLATYFGALRGGAGAERVFATQPIDFAVIDYTFPSNKKSRRGIFAYLDGRPDWALVYFDDAAVVYVRITPERAALVARDRYSRINPARYRPGSLSNLAPADLEASLAEIDRALRSAPRSTSAILLKCEVLAGQHRDAEALTLLDGALADDPDNGYATMVAARFAKQAGQRDRALGYYRRVVRLLPQVEDLRREMEATFP